MKNNSKIVSIILLLVLCFNMTVCAAKYIDVEENSPYYEAVEFLADAKIVVGYDGKFNPDNLVTRAEMVAIVNRLQGLSNAAKAAAGVTMYTDVAINDWFAGDVNLASQMGIVSGDGNGLFRPNDSVRYDEAIKMMVTALGYSYNDALAKGGWPDGYINIAKEQGVIEVNKKTDIVANRGEVALIAQKTFMLLKKGAFDNLHIKGNNLQLWAEDKKIDNVFQYENREYSLHVKARVCFEKEDYDRELLLRLKYADAKKKEMPKEQSVRVAVPAGDEEVDVMIPISFQKKEWNTLLNDGLKNNKDSSIWFCIYSGDASIGEMTKTFSYTYKTEKSVLDSVEVSKVEFAALNSKNEIIQKGNQIIKYANLSKLQLGADITFDKYYDDITGELLLFPVVIEIYETNVRYEPKKLVDSFSFLHMPVASVRLQFWWGNEYSLYLGAGKYIFVLKLFDKEIYRHKFELKNP